MKNKLFSPGSWAVKTRLMVPVVFVLLVIVIVIGLNSVTGLALGLIAFSIIILSVTHRWRRIRSFLFLAGGTFLGAVIVSGIFMEIAVPLAVRIGGQGALTTTPWKIFQAIVSDGMLLFGASAVLIGIAGAILLAVSRAWTEFRRPSTP